MECIAKRHHGSAAAKTFPGPVQVYGGVLLLIFFFHKLIYHNKKISLLKTGYQIFVGPEQQLLQHWCAEWFPKPYFL